ncbi:hypothetical protein H9L10_14715 [Phycicoccus endophyticus]|uniref:DUF4328 domain-containing protein n=1 Tax=Phycicoccus endophyticus TaxID=1690220 RepID=A0A7G9R1E2_9MICO|nr:hypothetical protein [Phycicoccus endophyticus]NHI18798.1 hypothetical protein [Phycicoccus endophyticus]QNN49417.1 hypothetical protein H9L10_14715 [Phycicoccus endophyticus]GGL36482.1 hypothetical protein GCM10012283_18610 [Phycicoccus endophyticus]
MHALILWCGFAGGWLLVAGPVYQAAVELSEMDVERSEISALAEEVTPPKRTSPWWWLLPPVAYVLRRRESEAYQRRVVEAMTPRHLEQFVAFTSKATGWLFVAVGALLIATKETYELAEHLEWPSWAVWAVAAGMALLCSLNTAVRMQRARALLERRAAPEPGA